MTLGRMHVVSKGVLHNFILFYPLKNMAIVTKTDHGCFIKSINRETIYEQQQLLAAINNFGFLVTFVEVKCLMCYTMD